MTVALPKAVKPLRKLRKLFKKFPADPRPEKVHTLRTHTRRLEATLATLTQGHDPDAGRLLKVVTPVRKAAGKVRDLDVHIANVMALQQQHEGEGLVRLVEHLAEMRAKYVDRLQDEVERRAPKARRRLKRCAKGIRQAFDRKSPAAEADAARLQVLAQELEHWPRLNAKNLHPFRIRIKELQYMLQLVPESRNTHIEALGGVKDAVGEWHDWLELQQIALDVLDPQVDRRVLAAIKRTVQDKFHAGLTSANALRAKGFQRMLASPTPKNGHADRSRHPARRTRASH